MSGVKLSSIQNILKDYENSDKGKKHIQSIVKAYQDKGISTTRGGGRILTDEDMYEAAAKFIHVLNLTADEYDLPDSIKKHFRTMGYSKIHKLADGTEVIWIYFTDDLSRQSLYSDGYDGVENIVALFNKGYEAKNFVYGDWDGHSPTGEARVDNRSIESSAYIRSRIKREGLHFMQQAVSDFNGNYGSDYNVIAKIGKDYE